MKLELTKEEGQLLRQQKVKQANILDYSPQQLQELLSTTSTRAQEIHALAAFQQIPSVGIKFAKDLIFLGYYSLEELKDKEGADLVNAYEKKKNYQIDPCVEDQFRLAVHVAQTGDFSKNWWDFTPARKAYRAAKGYPADRPTTHWTSVYFDK